MGCETQFFALYMQARNLFSVSLSKSFFSSLETWALVPSTFSNSASRISVAVSRLVVHLTIEPAGELTRAKREET